MGLVILAMETQETPLAFRGVTTFYWLNLLPETSKIHHHTQCSADVDFASYWYMSYSVGNKCFRRKERNLSSTCPVNIYEPVYSGSG